MKLRILLYFILAIVNVPCIGQNRIYNYLRYTVNEGLPSDIIRDLEQDDKGLIWLTSNRGLSYFDGFRFVTLKMNKVQSNVSNDLGDLSIDQSNHKIWITTFNHGLYCYDLTQTPDKALTIIDAKVGTSEIIKRELYAVQAAKNGLVYFGGQETDLQVYNPIDKSLQVIELDAVKDHKTIFCLYEDEIGNLWIGTRYHGIYRYNLESGNIVHLDLDQKGENGANGFVLANEELFSTYYNQDLVKIDPNYNKMTALNLLGWTKNVDFYDNSITSLAFLKNENKLLIGHVSRGLYTYDLANQDIEHITWSSIFPFEDIQGKVNSILTTKNGYYVASSKGLFYYGNANNCIADFISFQTDEPILNVFKIGSDLYYLTKNSIGLLSKDLKQRLSRVSLNALNVSQVNVENNKVYLSTYDQGVFEFLFKEKRIKPLDIIGEDHGFRKSDCNRVIYDRDTNGEDILWIGSWNSGLYKYMLESNKIYLYQEEDGLIDHKIITLGKDKDDRIWIGTDGYGLVLLEDKIDVKFKSFAQSMSSQSINSNTIFSFYLDHNKRFWYTSFQPGINQISYQDTIFDFSNYWDILPNDWSYIKTIVEDAKSNLWMRGDDGIMLFNTTTKGFNYFYVGEGIYPPKNYDVNSFYLDESKLVWITDKGFIYGNSQNVQQQNLLDSKPIISQFKILNKDETYQLYTNKVKLNPGEHAFTFYYSASKITKGIRFAYMLEGLDKDWIIGDEFHQANYTNINEGSYQFKLKVGDFNGNWSDEIVSIPVEVNVEWYRSLWFKLAMISCVIFVVLFFLYYRINHHKKMGRLQMSFNETLKKKLIENELMITKQNESLEIQRKEKLELDFKKQLYESELRAIRAQMNPHFIFNVLNSIEAYIVENDADHASAMIQKFARLSRKVLENSQSVIVSLGSELKLVQLYLALEQERFSYKFDYNIVMENKTSLKNRLIPSMLIQPIVENAIHHGIRDLIDKKGMILLQIEEIEETIIIDVFDNGVGMKNSSNFKHAFKSKSFGLKAVENRLEMINTQFNSPIASVEYFSDLIDTEYTTQVRITLPAQYQFEN